MTLGCQVYQSTSCLPAPWGTTDVSIRQSGARLPSRCVREATAASTACLGAVGAAVAVKAVAKRERCWLPDFRGRIFWKSMAFTIQTTQVAAINNKQSRFNNSLKGWGVVPRPICTKNTFWPYNCTLKKQILL